MITSFIAEEIFSSDISIKYKTQSLFLVSSSVLVLFSLVVEGEGKGKFFVSTGESSAKSKVHAQPARAPHLSLLTTIHEFEKYVCACKHSSFFY